METQVMKYESDSTKAIGMALLEVQKEIYSAGGVKKSGVNPRFHNKYAKLQDIQEFVIPIASRHGIAVSQEERPSRYPGEGSVVTKLRHPESGEWICSWITAPPMEQVSYDKTTKEKKTDITPQSLLSSGTYCCRRGLISIFCLPTYDDDGEAASKRDNTQQSYPKKPKEKPSTKDKPKVKVISAKLRNELIATVKANGWVDDIKEILSGFGYGKTADIHPKDYDDILAHVSSPKDDFKEESEAANRIDAKEAISFDQQAELQELALTKLESIKDLKLLLEQQKKQGNVQHTSLSDMTNGEYNMVKIILSQLPNKGV
jgi:hypothetical protein